MNGSRSPGQSRQFGFANSSFPPAAAKGIFPTAGDARNAPLPPVAPDNGLQLSRSRVRAVPEAHAAADAENVDVLRLREASVGTDENPAREGLRAARRRGKATLAEACRYGCECGRNEKCERCHR